MLATYVLETVGHAGVPSSSRQRFLRAVRRRVRRRGGRRRRPAPASAALPGAELAGAHRSSRRRAALSSSTCQPRPDRGGPRRRRRRPAAGHAARGLPRGPVPDGPRRARRGPARLVVPGPARRPAARRACASAGRCARSLRALRGPRGHRLRRGGRRLRRPRRDRALDHAGDRRGATPSCTGWAGRTRSSAGRTGRLVGGLYGMAIGGLFAGESMFHRETDASKVGARRPGGPAAARTATPRRLLDVQWRDRAPGHPGCGRGAAVGVPAPAAQAPWPLRVPGLLRRP